MLGADLAMRWRAECPLRYGAVQSSLRPPLKLGADAPDGVPDATPGVGTTLARLEPR